MNRKIYSQTRWIVTASEQLRRECLSRFGGDLSPRVRALYPPVDNPALSGAFSANGKGVPGKRLGVLARLDPKKGHGDILKAFAIVQKKYPDAELHIAGSEENLSWSELFARANAMGLKNCVYHGFLSREEVWNFTAECSAGVIGSLGSEEVSRALEEWMSQGRPVVATAVRSIPEILEDGKGGYLVPPGRPEEMAGKLCRILEDEKLRERMARHNFESCRGRFSRDVFNTGWKEILA
ncbi:MAG: hypothetical protein A2902_04010 [Elusimicrobia bacterium RIFCSPLOWO2_01_FULL_64_13]|nr:MAG: hypothetical protein A2902_04010 [Elusimicrobia bacterium RIFCSPLOWO2_01_FULL_64_13]